jgi:hypothetical protein
VRGDDQHRQLLPGAAQSLEDLDAAAARQAEVQQRELVDAVRERDLRLGAVVRSVDGVAAVAQAGGDGPADHRIVLDEEHSHGARFTGNFTRSLRPRRLRVA